MMPNFSNWYAESRMVVVDAEQRAVLCWLRIQDRPTSITLDRNGTPLSAQTVRVEYGELANPARNDVSEGVERDVWVIGVKDHPTVTDTDIKRGDRFSIGRLTYKVLDVISVPGEVQARCQRMS